MFRNSDDHREPSRKGKHLIALLMLATIFIILQSSYFLQFLFYPNHSPTSSFHCFLVESIGNVLSVAGLLAKLCDRRRYRLNAFTYIAL